SIGECTGQSAFDCQSACLGIASSASAARTKPGRTPMQLSKPMPDAFSRCRSPVIGAPLFIVSNPNLGIAQCKAGIVGSFPALNARPQSQLDEWLHEIPHASGQTRHHT